MRQKPETIEEAFLIAPLGMLTVVIPNDKKIFEIEPENVQERREYREGECLECENGIATYIDTYTTKSVKITNGADVNEEVWLTSSEIYKEVWYAAFDAGLVQPSIIISEDGEWIANPLDVDPIEIWDS